MLIDVETGPAAPAAPRGSSQRDSRLSAIKKELESANGDVRQAGEELIVRLKVCLAAAFARRVDSAVTIQGRQSAKEKLSADAASFEQESTRQAGV